MNTEQKYAAQENCAMFNEQTADNEINNGGANPVTGQGLSVDDLLKAIQTLVTGTDKVVNLFVILDQSKTYNIHQKHSHGNIFGSEEVDTRINVTGNVRQTGTGNVIGSEDIKTSVYETTLTGNGNCNSIDSAKVSASVH